MIGLKETRLAPVTIYTKKFCPYCTAALALLKQKGAQVTEIDAGFNREKTAEMIQRSNGGRTYPQIFIGDTHVGGCDDLHELDAEGGLDPLLAGA
jgi:glutaredoxin 3